MIALLSLHEEPTMLPRTCVQLALLMALTVAPAWADLTVGLQTGTPDLKSMGPMAFGPDGVLFVGDTMGAAVFAIDTGDRMPGVAGPFKVQAVNEKIAALLGTDPKQIRLNDLAVNPASGKAYLSVSRGTGPDAAPVLVRVDREGKIEEVPLKGIKFAKVELTNVPSPEEKDRRGGMKRLQSITSLAYVDGRVFVAGLSNEEFNSTLRSIPYPFQKGDRGSGIRIYHGAHGAFETHAPIRTFLPYSINGEPHILAAYTCTPLVKIPVSELKPGAKVQGTTVAELGNRNNPLDMVVYEKDGKEYILLANSSRGIMKIATDNIDKIAGITEPVRGGGTAGLPYETISGYTNNVQQLSRLDKEHVLLLVRGDDGSLNLESLPLP